MTSSTPTSERSLVERLHELADAAENLWHPSAGKWIRTPGELSLFYREAADALASQAGEIEEARARLQQMTDYADAVMGAFKNGRGYLDMTGFLSLIPEARAFLTRT